MMTLLIVLLVLFLLGGGGGDILAGAGSAGWQVGVAPGPEWSDCSVAASYRPEGGHREQDAWNDPACTRSVRSCVGRVYVYDQGKGR